MEHVPISPRPDLPFEERIEALEHSFSGRLEFHGVHLELGEEVGLREDELFPTAWHTGPARALERRPG